MHNEDVSGNFRKFEEFIVEGCPEIEQVFLSNETSEKETKLENETGTSLVEEIE